MSSLLRTPKSPAPLTSLPDGLADKLRGLARRLRRIALIRGIGLTLAVSGAMTAAGLAVDLLFDLPTPLRIGWLGLTGATAIALFGWFVVRPLLRRYSGINLAAVVERGHPELGERLSSLVELTHAETPANWRGSPVMLEHLTVETLRATDAIDFNSAVPAARSMRIGLLGMSAALLLILPAIFAPENYRLLLTRFLVPWGNYERAGDVYFEVPGGDRVAARGHNLMLRAIPHSRSGKTALPREARIEFSGASGRGDGRTVGWSEADGGFVATIPRVQDDFRFAFAAGNARSRTYSVYVVDPPRIEACMLHVQPPDYTKLPTTSHDGAVGEVTVFEQSRLRFELSFADEVATAELLQGRGDAIAAMFASTETASETLGGLTRLPLKIAADGRSASVEFIVEQGGPYEFLIVDQHGFHNTPTAARRLRIRRDLPPRITVAPSDAPLMIPPGGPLTVVASAEDDIAISRLELRIELPGGETRVFDAPADRLGTADANHTFDVELPSELSAAGATFSYLLRATDNRPAPGPQSVTSEPQTVIVEQNAPSAQEQALLREHERLSHELAEIHDEVRQQQQRVSARNETEDTQSLRNLTTQQKQLAQRLEQVADEFQERPVLSSLAPAARAIAREQLEQAARDTERGMSGSAEDRAKSLQASADKLDGADDALAELRRQFDKLARLEHDLLDLDRMAAQAQALSQQLAALNRRKAELAAQPDTPERKKQLQELAQQQRQAEEQAAKLSEQLKELVEKHPEILEAARRAKLQELGRLGHAAQGIADAQHDLSTTIENEPGSESDLPDDATEEYLGVIAAQRELARQMIEFTRQAANLLGSQAEPTQQALQMAAEAHRTAAAAANGQLSQAAKAAKQASDAAAQMSADQPELKEQAEALRQKQQELAQQISEMAADPQRRKAAQQFGQKNLDAHTRELQRQLQEAANDLEAEPLNLTPQGEQTRQAEQQTAQAHERMGDASNALEQNQSQQAGRQGHQASSILSDVARAIGELAGQQQSEPGEMPAQPADDIAQAMQQMQQAQQRLDQSQNSQQPPDAQNQPGDGNATPQGASEAMQQAADSLSQATESLQPGQGQQQARRNQGKRAQQTGQAGTPGSASGGSGSNAAAAELAELREEFERLSGRHWGELPGTLRTEILESALQRPGGDYAALIRRYFRELAKTKRERTSARE